jgi:hypothetical protein
VAHILQKSFLYSDSTFVAVALVLQFYCHICQRCQRAEQHKDDDNRYGTEHFFRHYLFLVTNLAFFLFKNKYVEKFIFWGRARGTNVMLLAECHLHNSPANSHKSARVRTHKLTYIIFLTIFFISTKKDNYEKRKRINFASS